MGILKIQSRAEGTGRFDEHTFLEFYTFIQLYSCGNFSYSNAKTHNKLPQDKVGMNLTYF